MDVNTERMIGVLRELVAQFQKAYQLTDRETVSAMMVIMTETAERVTAELNKKVKEIGNG